MFQPKFPLEMSDLYGAYESTRDLKQNIKQNALFLLQTSPGEWPGNPEIGVGLRHYLFENYPSAKFMSIKKRIKDQFAKYMPFLQIDSEIVEKDREGNNLVDNNAVKLIIRYNILPLNETDQLEMTVLE